MKNKDIIGYAEAADTKKQLVDATWRLKGHCEHLHREMHLLGEVCKDCNIVIRGFTKAFNELG